MEKSWIETKPVFLLLDAGSRADKALLRTSIALPATTGDIT
jgi:hypothetical protein